MARVKLFYGLDDTQPGAHSTENTHHTDEPDIEVKDFLEEWMAYNVYITKVIPHSEVTPELLRSFEVGIQK